MHGDGFFETFRFTLNLTALSYKVFHGIPCSILNKFNDCKDHRNKKEVPDPIVKDLISDKIRKRNKSKADLTVENFV